MTQYSLPTARRVDSVRLVQSATTLVVTVVLAEWFYKFHSFTLEFIAALATWFVLDYMAFQAVALARRGTSDRRTSE